MKPFVSRDETPSSKALNSQFHPVKLKETRGMLNQ